MLMFGSQYLIFIHKLYGNAKTFVKYNTNETFDLMISQNEIRKKPKLLQFILWVLQMCESNVKTIDWTVFEPIHTNPQMSTSWWNQRKGQGITNASRKLTFPSVNIIYFSVDQLAGLTGTTKVLLKNKIFHNKSWRRNLLLGLKKASAMCTRSNIHTP